MSDQERLDRAIEELLAGRSPRAEAPHLEPEEQAMLQMAQLIRGSRPEPARRDFVDRLHDRLFPMQGRVSRRAAVVAGLGTLAAGIVGGFGLDRVLNGFSVASTPSLVGSKGKWFSVAGLTDVPDGAVRPFAAGAVQGYLINRGGNLRALSRICTHMGCQLDFERDEQSFVCPCHGAEFNLQGDLRYGPKTRYGQDLPPLPPIEVRVKGDKVQVKGA